MGDPHEIIHEALSDTYELEDEIGAGGMGTVFRARDRKHERSVAIKVIHPELASGAELTRFEREIRVTAKLQHPHILPLLDSGTAGDLAYYVTPFVDGESLRDLIRRRGKLPVEEAIKLTIDVAEALEHAHQQGIVHRDIKPENILVSNGEAIVADFGLARAMCGADQATLTATGSIVGTPLYVSPEQLAGLQTIDARPDLYSLACVVYELLTGQPPFVGANISDILKQHIYERPEPLPGSVPGGMRGALMKALSKRPAERQGSVGEFAASIRNSGEGSRSRMPAWVLPAVAALVIVALVIAWRNCAG
jgi:serine/threonine-protein kinase